MLVTDRRDHLVAHAVGGTQPEFLLQFVEHVDRASLGVGKLRRLGHNGRKHLLEVERRVDGLRDFAERAQLTDRLRQFAGALFDLLFQVRVGILKPSRPCH